MQAVSAARQGFCSLPACAAMTRAGWQCAAWAALLGVTVISLTAVPPLPDQVPDWSDKLVHAMLYGVLMLLFAYGYALPPARTSPLRLAVALRLAVLLALWGCVIEWLQGLTGHRSASAADALANIAGIITTLALLARGGASSD